MAKTKRRPKKQGPSLKPHVVRGQPRKAWWYEEEAGIDVYRQVTSAEVGVVRVAIPWHLILRAAKRCGVLPDREGK